MNSSGSYVSCFPTMICLENGMVIWYSGSIRTWGDTWWWAWQRTGEHWQIIISILIDNTKKQRVIIKYRKHRHQRCEHLKYLKAPIKQNHVMQYRKHHQWHRKSTTRLLWWKIIWLETITIGMLHPTSTATTTTYHMDLTFGENAIMRITCLTSLIIPSCLVENTTNWHDTSWLSWLTSHRTQYVQKLTKTQHKLNHRQTKFPPGNRGRTNVKWHHTSWCQSTSTPTSANIINDTCEHRRPYHA